MATKLHTLTAVVTVQVKCEYSGDLNTPRKKKQFEGTTRTPLEHSRVQGFLQPLLLCNSFPRCICFVLLCEGSAKTL